MMWIWCPNPDSVPVPVGCCAHDCKLELEAQLIFMTMSTNLNWNWCPNPYAVLDTGTNWNWVLSSSSCAYS